MCSRKYLNTNCSRQIKRLNLTTSVFQQHFQPVNICKIYYYLLSTQPPFYSLDLLHTNSLSIYSSRQSSHLIYSKNTLNPLVYKCHHFILKYLSHWYHSQVKFSPSPRIFCCNMSVFNTPTNGL